MKLLIILLMAVPCHAYEFKNGQAILTMPDGSKQVYNALQAAPQTSEKRSENPTREKQLKTMRDLQTIDNF